MNFDVSKRVLVIAQSARMLLQMAIDSGFQAIAIDCFSDVDTIELADLAFKVDSLALADLKPILLKLQRDFGLMAVVYGSGFECFIDSLVYLEQHWPVLGNSSSLFKQFQAKRSLFQTFNQLSISYPEIRFAAPDNLTGKWLIKPMQGEGGQGIRFYSEVESISPSMYWQRYCAGQSYSALFLSSADSVQIIGFNRQLIVADSEDYFKFAGLIGQIQLPLAIRELIEQWLKKIHSVYPLKGLGSLDFMLENGQCYLLEINARVPASAQLYGKQIFKKHIQACLGSLDKTLPLPLTSSAYRVIYAKREICISDRVFWPKWVADRPESGAIIGKGQAICSIIASGKNSRQVALILIRRLRFMENLLKNRSLKSCNTKPALIN
jgi:methenyltetrahydromethanopterin cyclohydrolase